MSLGTVTAIHTHNQVTDAPSLLTLPPIVLLALQNDEGEFTLVFLVVPEPGPHFQNGLLDSWLYAFCCFGGFGSRTLKLCYFDEAGLNERS